MRARPVRAVPSPTLPAALVAALLAACGGGGGDATTPPGGGGPIPPGPDPWVIETADAGSADTGLNPSIAVDHLGTVHVSHLDVSNKTYRYARRTASGWTRSNIASSEKATTPTSYGKWSSIAVDGQGVPSVSYHVADVEYVYAKGNAAGTAWTTTSLPQDTIQYAFHGHNALAIDRDTGTAHVVTWEYHAASPWESLRAWSPGDSTKTLVSAPADPAAQLHHGIDCAVAVDSAGLPNISYVANSATTNHVMWADATGADAWSISTIEEVTRGTSSSYEERWTAIAMDSNDRPHVVFYQPATDRYRYATWTGSGWTRETIAQPALSMSGMVSIAIAVDASNVPHVAFYGLGDHVYYGKRTAPGAWATEVVDTSSADTGHGVAIAVGPEGKIHIAYRADASLSSRMLKYARR